MAPLVLALALTLAAAPSPRANLALECEGCFGLKIELDGEHLVSLAGLGAAAVQDGKLEVSKRPRLPRVGARTLQGKAVVSGTLFLAAGEEAVAGVHCQTGACESFGDPHAFHADPR